MPSDLTRNFNRKGVGHPSAEEAGKLYMQAVQSWLKEFEPKITPNHSLRCNMARVSVGNGKLRYERTADLVLKGNVTGMYQEQKVVARKVVRFAIEWDAE